MEKQDFIEEVRRCLGGERGDVRSLSDEEYEQARRLGREDGDLIERFVEAAREEGMEVFRCGRDESLTGKLCEIVRELDLKTVIVGTGELLERLGVRASLERLGGVEVLPIASDRDKAVSDSFEVDCSITAARGGLAETGSVVLQAEAEEPLVLSVAPPVHISVLEAKEVMADLIDFFQAEGFGQGIVTLVTGPSKTSDIEMTLVKGVHGPMAEYVFILEDGD